mgnify:CR=1 FL=1
MKQAKWWRNSDQTRRTFGSCCLLNQNTCTQITSSKDILDLLQCWVWMLHSFVFYLDFYQSRIHYRAVACSILENKNKQKTKEKYKFTHWYAMFLTRLFRKNMAFMWPWPANVKHTLIHCIGEYLTDQCLNVHSCHVTGSIKCLVTTSLREQIEFGMYTRTYTVLMWTFIDVSIVQDGCNNTYKHFRVLFHIYLYVWKVYLIW